MTRRGHACHVHMDYTPLDAPERAPVVFAEAWKRRDPVAIAALFDVDAQFVNVTGRWWHDREAIPAAHAYGLARIFDRSTLRLTSVAVTRLTEDVAVMHARMHLEGQTPVVSSPPPARGRTSSPS